MHLKRLEDLEYLLVHAGKRGRRYVYELLWDGEGIEGERFVMGLYDLAQLEELDDTANKSGTGDNKSAPPPKKSGPSRPHVGGMSGGWSAEIGPVFPTVSDGNGQGAPESALRAQTRERAVEAARRSVGD